MSITLAAVLLFAFTASQLGLTGALFIMALAGFGFSAHFVLPWSIVPDTIEYAFARSGIRREGIYYSLWIFVVAVAGAFAGFLVGQCLDIFGYAPNMAQSATAILGIKLLIGPAPAVFIFLGNLIMVFYPLDPKQYEVVQAKIREREAPAG